MGNYYFVATALPPLQLGVPPDISFEEFINLLRDNLNDSDYKKTKSIRLYYDLKNIRALWNKEEFDYRANYNEWQLDEALLTRSGLPAYVYDFLDRYDNKKERIHFFPSLIMDYFRLESARATGFLKRYFKFEREWRLVLVAFRAKKQKINLATELQFEDPNDIFVAQMMAQKDAKTIIAPEEYADLQAIFEEFENEPLELYKAITAYRFHKIESLLGVDMFSIDKILGYMAQLILAEKWIELDKQKGMELLKSFD